MARQKQEIQQIRATAAEREQWRAAAEAEGVTISDYIRRAIRTAEVGRLPRRQRRPEPLPVDPELKRQLAAIGSNVNQIAKAVNTWKRRIDARRLYILLDEINDELSEIERLARNDD